MKSSGSGSHDGKVMSEQKSKRRETGILQAEGMSEPTPLNVFSFFCGN